MVTKLKIIEGKKGWYCQCGMAHDVMYMTDKECYCERCVPTKIKNSVKEDK